MTSRLSVDGGGLAVDVAAGDWLTVRSPAPRRLLDAVAGTRADVVDVAIDGRNIGPQPPPARVAAGLQVVTSTVPALPELRVLDVVLLGAWRRRPPLWQSLLATDGARAAATGHEAAARALAGRVGLGRWLDVPALDLPPGIAALTDLTRALLAQPVALVWRRPQWLAEGDDAALADVVADEQRRLGYAVLEVISDGGTV
jgi:branched-chain amino acid transport system ATP-binding protein